MLCTTRFVNGFAKRNVAVQAAGRHFSTVTSTTSENEKPIFSGVTPSLDQEIVSKMPNFRSRPVYEKYPTPTMAERNVRAHVTHATYDEMHKNPNLKERKVPIQLRYSGDNGQGGESAMGGRLLVDNRIRKGPYYHLSQEAGAWCYTVYNRHYHPRAYTQIEDGGLEAEYRALTEDVTLWNVACERQIQVKGPDAEKFIDYVITRKASLCKTGKCRYVILCNQDGGVLNDPIMLRPHEDEFWLSLSDSDILLFLQGVNHDGRYDVEINEIDVAPVQIQGPKSTMLMEALVGKEIWDVPYYGLHFAEIGGAKTVISRTGWSTERGYEIYLYDATRDAEKMWYKILEAGKQFNLRVIAPGHHRRIEAGILSWGQDVDVEVNPFECGLGWQCDFSKEDFIGKKALAKIKEDGVKQQLVGLRIDGGLPITYYLADYYHVRDQETDELIGYCTSGWFSFNMQKNIAFAMVPVSYKDIGRKVNVVLPDLYKDPSLGNVVPAEVVNTPFKTPDKEEYGTGLRTTGSKL